MNTLLEKKFNELKSTLFAMDSVLVAYSGGVDSAFLLKVVSMTVKGDIVAVTAESLTYPTGEKEKAIELVNVLGVKHIVIEIDELANANFVENNKDRCYWCKRELFSKMKKIAQEEGISKVLEASNHDDTFDYRPGTKAVKELGIISPLIDLKFTKDEIREISKSLDLPTWDKPSMACLSFNA